MRIIIYLFYSYPLSLLMNFVSYFRIISFCLLFTCATFSFAQKHSQNQKITGDIKQADDYFKDQDFENALNEYLVIIKKDSSNEKYNYRIGVCYLNTDIDKTKAIPYFERIENNSSEEEIKYLLARAYQYDYRFDDAIHLFEKYVQIGKGSSANRKDAERQIQYCINAKELMKFPLHVSFENLGKNINSPYPDYFPFVPSDESFLIFNTKRPQSGSYQNPDGSWEANIYLSKVKNGEYAKSKPLGRIINSRLGDEEAVGLSSNGEYLLVYYNNAQSFGDIYISKTDRHLNFKAPILLDDQINSLQGQEISASITTDGNTIYFASTRSGGFGGSDLYVCQRLPNREWGPAQNLGKGINTSQNEDFPNISPDGKMLYFSSMGHTSMGGYDIFAAVWNDTTHTFANPKNIGYPINTPEDDMNFRISATGKYGYISAKKKGGFGDLDVYRVNFMDVEPEYTVLLGKTISTDITKPVDSSHVEISVVASPSNELFGTYMPNPRTGRFVIILPPGEYKISTAMPGFLPYSESIQVMDKSSFKAMIQKNILLIPEGESKSSVPVKGKK